MARSTRIYIIMRRGYDSHGVPIAAFTVKREAIKFINQFDNKNDLLLYGGSDGHYLHHESSTMWECYYEDKVSGDWKTLK